MQRLGVAAVEYEVDVEQRSGPRGSLSANPKAIVSGGTTSIKAQTILCAENCKVRL